MKNIDQILNSLDETLQTMKYGLDSLFHDKPEYRKAAIRNVVVFGRAVTNVLQNFRGIIPEFDIWYSPKVKEMESDPLLKFFYKLRSEILKEGTLPTAVSSFISHLNGNDIQRRFGAPPPNAKSFFICDQNGGSGWEIQSSDGSILKYYVDIPGDIVQVQLFFRDAPSKHLGKDLLDKNVESLAQLYYEYLAKIVAEAKSKYGNVA